MKVGIKWSDFYCNDSVSLLFLNFVFLWTYDIFTHWRWQKVLTIVLCNCALRGGQPMRLETRKTLHVLKRFVTLKKCVHLSVCTVVVVITREMENAKYNHFFAAIGRVNFGLLKNILQRTSIRKRLTRWEESWEGMDITDKACWKQSNEIGQPCTMKGEGEVT